MPRVDKAKSEESGYVIGKAKEQTLGCSASSKLSNSTPKQTCVVGSVAGDGLADNIADAVYPAEQEITRQSGSGGPTKTTHSFAFVLDVNGNRLTPVNSILARKLLRRGKAIVLFRFPFTIQLFKEVKNVLGY